MSILSGNLQMQKARKAFDSLVSKPGAKTMRKEVTKVEPEPEPEPAPEPAPTVEPVPKPEAEAGSSKPAVSIPITAPKDDNIDPEVYSRGLITDVVLLMQHVKDDGQNVNEPTKMLQQAKEEFMYKDYDRANELAFSAREILIKMKPELFKVQAEKDIDDIRSYFEELRSIGVETEPLERNMKSILDDFQNNDFVRVLDSCLKLKNKAKRLKMEFLKVTLKPRIGELRSELKQKKDSGLDVTEIESYLADAEGSISDEDYDGACALYKKSQELYGSMPSEEEHRKQGLGKRLESLKASIKDNAGFKLDFSDVEQTYASIETHLAGNEPDKAEKELDEAHKKFDAVMKKYAQKVQKRVELEIEDVALSGADPSGFIFVEQVSGHVVGVLQQFCRESQFIESFQRGLHINVQDHSAQVKQDVPDARLL